MKEMKYSPTKEDTITGFRPNLSDHGPINKLAKAGKRLSTIVRAIKNLAAYGCTNFSIISVSFVAFCVPNLTHSVLLNLKISVHA